jgi:hypothetical protein
LYKYLFTLSISLKNIAALSQFKPANTLLELVKLRVGDSEGERTVHPPQPLEIMKRKEMQTCTDAGEIQ